MLDQEQLKLKSLNFYSKECFNLLIEHIQLADISMHDYQSILAKLIQKSCLYSPEFDIKQLPNQKAYQMIVKIANISLIKFEIFSEQKLSLKKLKKISSLESIKIMFPLVYNWVLMD